MVVTKDTLSDVMEFDHVVEVHPDGTVTDGPADMYAPSLHDGELDDARWSMLNGYSGQYGYSGPVMHPSEFIGGGLAADILSTPGFYVSVVAYCDPVDDEGDEGDDVDGWAVCRFEGARS
jgi:hypothetical protein